MNEDWDELEGVPGRNRKEFSMKLIVGPLASLMTTNDDQQRSSLRFVAEFGSHQLLTKRITLKCPG